MKVAMQILDVKGRETQNQREELEKNVTCKSRVGRRIGFLINSRCNSLDMRGTRNGANLER